MSRINSLRAIGASLLVLVCVLVPRYLATPPPLRPHAASIPTHESGLLIESDTSVPFEPPLVIDPVTPGEIPPSGDGADHSILLARQCLALAERDPLAAMEMAVANQLQDVDPGLATSLIAQWAVQDFARAYEWTKAQDPGASRDDMLAHLAYLRALADPVAAAHLVATDIPAGPARDEAVISVIHQWALRDTEAAGRWAQSFPDDTLRQRASAEVAALAARLPR